MLAYTYYETDNRVRKYAETLAKRGDHVDVIALRHKGQIPHEVINGVNIYRVQKRVIDERKNITYLFKVMAFLILSFTSLTVKHLKKPYDLIHVHSVPDFEVFAALITKYTGARIILDIHDIVPEFYASKFNAGKNSIIFKLLKIIERLSIAFADHVIISNDIWNKVLVSRSLDEKKCLTILNYPDTNIFYKRERQREDSKFIITYPGTLAWHQGLDIAVKAVAIIKEQAPEVELHIHGEGDSKNSLIALISQLGLEGRVFLKPILPIDEVADVMGRSDLGIVPKRANGFGNAAFSTKILEFMALGVPVLISKTRIDQYYFDESLVTFFEPENERDLAEKILLVIKDKELRETKAANSIRYIGENNWDVKKGLYIDLVDSLCRPGIKGADTDYAKV